MGRQRSLLALIMILAIAAITVIALVPVRLGLDLQGGSQLTLEVQTTDAVREITPEKLEGVKRVVENRINGLGVSETAVQTVGSNQLSIQLPGVSNPAEAERVLGGTAQLDFRTQRPGTEAQFPIEFQVQRVAIQELEVLKAQKADQAAIEAKQAEVNRSNEAIAALFEPTGLTGNSLQNAYPQPTSGNVWNVVLVFDQEGGKRFAEISKGLAGTGRSVGIFLDNRLLSAPVVPAQYAAQGITGGSVQIEGRFTTQAASELAVQLRGGALPVPVKVVENRTVGATLGQDSIQRSIYAGLAGLILVLVFMVLYYRLPGAIANIALILYALFTLAIFNLLGVVLTLPGIAGFILSIGMAVDANVLIFERMREELQSGKTLYRSVESGFYRAFSSILDSNLTTLIACFALLGFGAWITSGIGDVLSTFGVKLPSEITSDPPGLVKGFAVTLAIGILVSMFTALTCSRTLLLLAISIPSMKKFHWYAPKVGSFSSQVEKTS
jgi:preprotein translocase subunit SecD